MLKVRSDLALMHKSSLMEQVINIQTPLIPLIRTKTTATGLWTHCTSVSEKNAPREVVTASDSVKADKCRRSKSSQRSGNKKIGYASFQDRVTWYFKHSHQRDPCLPPEICCVPSGSVTPNTHSQLQLPVCPRAETEWAVTLGMNHSLVLSAIIITDMIQEMM